MTLWDMELLRIVNKFPNFKVIAFEDSWFFSFLRKLGLEAVAITWYSTVFMVRERIGTDKGAEILRHEAVHVADMHNWNILFFLSYFFLLPVGPSLKAVWEWRGYRENLCWLREHQSKTQSGSDREAEEIKMIDWVANQFCGDMYLWMWPFKADMVKRCKRFMASLPPV